MQLTYKFLDQIASLTNRELDFLLYIIRYQDDEGVVEGVFYKDICKEVSMCKQTFYNTLQSLRAKGVISFQPTSDHDYTIIIHNNKGYGKEKNGYINLNRKFFRDTKFKSLKAKEKYMLLDFLKITHSNRGVYVISPAAFYEKYQRVLGISKRVVRYYLQSLHGCFHVQTHKGLYYISYIADQFRKIEAFGKGQRREYLAKVICRRAGLKVVSKEDILDVAGMIQGQGGMAERAGYSILQLLKTCIAACIGEQTHSWPVLKPKRVNMLLMKCLND